MHKLLDDAAIAAEIRYHPRLQKVIAYLLEHKTGPVSLRQAARVACMEMTGFSRFFKQTTGIGFRSFVEHWRLARAIELMESQDYTVTQVAHLAGFNLGTFQRRFKKLVGCTPLEYKKIIVANIDAQIKRSPTISGMEGLTAYKSLQPTCDAIPLRGEGSWKSKKLLDLSLSISESPSELVPVRIQYVPHREGAKQMARIFGLTPNELPNHLGWAGEEVHLITHAGTHMDAPWHYGPGSPERPARTIDEVPLDWCFNPGVVLDFRKKEEGTTISIDDLKNALTKIGYRLRAGDIVLLYTGADQWWGHKSYPDRGVGLGREATLWLIGQGVRIIGTDAWGLDRPFRYMRQEYQKTRNIDCIWPTHYAGCLQEYCQLEKLTNLQALPPYGFDVICFPVKVARASAGWARVVAML
ncbi:MAG TPA: cyclase family protein [Candidatus Angelobacter sp.]|nr:cyclase family protein [Candidatus Angelobacter sp.]